MLAKERRSRVIRFRVSPDESERLTKFLPVSGARSLSDLARTALIQAMSGQNQPAETAVLGELRKMDGTLREIHDELGQIRHMLAESGLPARAAAERSAIKREYT